MYCQELMGSAKLSILLMLQTTQGVKDTIHSNVVEFHTIKTTIQLPFLILVETIQNIVALHYSVNDYHWMFS